MVTIVFSPSFRMVQSAIVVTLFHSCYCSLCMVPQLLLFHLCTVNLNFHCARLVQIQRINIWWARWPLYWAIKAYPMILKCSYTISFCMMMLLLSVVCQCRNSVLVPHPLYCSSSPHKSTLCDFFLKLKLVFERKKFYNITVINEESQLTFQDLEMLDFHRSIHQWQNHLSYHIR